MGPQADHDRRRRRSGGRDRGSRRGDPCRRRPALADRRDRLPRGDGGVFFTGAQGWAVRAVVGASTSGRGRRANGDLRRRTCSSDGAAPPPAVLVWRHRSPTPTRINCSPTRRRAEWWRADWAGPTATRRRTQADSSWTPPRSPASSMPTSREGSSPRVPAPASTSSCAGSSPAVGSWSLPELASSPSAARSRATSTARATMSTGPSATRCNRFDSSPATATFSMSNATPRPISSGPRPAGWA